MIYTFECLGCGRKAERVMPASQYTSTAECEWCGSVAARVFVPARLAQVSVMKPFVTSDITGDPVEITSRRQEKALCDRHGLAPVGTQGARGRKRPQAAMATTVRDDYEKLRQRVGDPTGDRAVDLVLGRK